jgi:hypothetical protein
MTRVSRIILLFALVGLSSPSLISQRAEACTVHGSRVTAASTTLITEDISAEKATGIRSVMATFVNGIRNKALEHNDLVLVHSFNICGNAQPRFLRIVEEGVTFTVEWGGVSDGNKLHPKERITFSSSVISDTKSFPQLNRALDGVFKRYDQLKGSM